MHIDPDEKIPAAEFTEFYADDAGVWLGFCVADYDNEGLYDKHYNKLTKRLDFENPDELLRLGDWEGTLVGPPDGETECSISGLFHKWRQQRDCLRVECVVTRERFEEFQAWCNKQPEMIQDVKLM